MLTRPTQSTLSLFDAFGDPSADLIHIVTNTSQQALNIVLNLQIWGNNVLHLAACKQNPVTFQAIINNDKISQELLIAALLERDFKGRSAFHLVVKFQDYSVINSLLTQLSPFTINKLLQYITNETIPFCIDENNRLSQTEKANIKQRLQNITQFTQQPAESIIKYPRAFMGFVRERLPCLSNGAHALEWLGLLNAAARSVDKLNLDDEVIKDQFYAYVGRANYNVQMKVTVYPKTSKYLDDAQNAYSKITSLNNITADDQYLVKNGYAITTKHSSSTSHTAINLAMASQAITTAAAVIPENKEMEHSKNTITLRGDSLSAFLTFGVIIRGGGKATIDVAPSQEASATNKI